MVERVIGGNLPRKGEFTMTQPVPMTEIWRGPFLESVHLGHAVVCDDSGQTVRSWGDPNAVI